MALVVGVGAYRHLPKLENTVADAGLIADKLRATGFDVVVSVDPSKDDLNRAVRDFGRRVEAAGSDVVAAFYYAGHGVQDDKQSNYLLGADAELRSQVDLPLEGLSLDSVLQTLDAAAPALSFVILDACRDNPLPASSRRGATRGLAPIPERRGLVTVFSTEPGKTAQDGPDGGHSPFASALAEGLDAQGVETQALFRQVARKVLDATRQEQFPLVVERLTEDFYFRPPASDGGRSATAVPVATAVPGTAEASRSAEVGPADAGEIAFGRAVLDNTAEAYEAWLQRFPDHARKPSVLALLQRLREGELWKRVENSASTSEAISAAEMELMAFPDGAFADRARERLRTLRAQPVSSADPAPAQPPDADTIPALPSYNCARAATDIERLICASPALAAKDRQLAAVFERALARADSAPDLQRAQQAWVDRRDACGNSDSVALQQQCVALAYDSRITALQATTEDERADLSPATGSEKPSFNCDLARLPAEKLICAVPQLAAADRRLAALYASAVGRAGSATAVQDSEALWRRGRDACTDDGTDEAAARCIFDAYQKRIAELQTVNEMPSDGGPPSTSPSFDCARGRLPIEGLICATPELAQLDRDLASAYLLARKRVANVSALAATQSSWRSRRNTCAVTLQRPNAIKCAEGAYRERIAELATMQ